MIQRVQSIFLLIVVIISTLLFFVTFAEFPYGTEVFEQTIIGTSSSAQPGADVASTWYAAVINGLVGAIALITIFMFRNRKLQMLLGNFNLVLTVAMIVLMFLASGKYSESLVKGVVLPVKYQAGAYLPIGLIIFTWLANRFIKKDDDLVRSADRIR